MIDDPLAQYRKTPAAASGAATSGKEKEEYAAFGTKDKVHRLQIRSVAAPVNSLGYNILLNVVHDGDKGTHVILVYSILMVLVQGRRLEKMVFAIENGMADYIQQFDPARWPKPKETNTAVIDSIEIKVTERAGQISE